LYHRFPIFSTAKHNLTTPPVEDYRDAYFGVTEKVKPALEASNLMILFPQRDVHMINAPTS